MVEQEAVSRSSRTVHGSTLAGQTVLVTGASGFIGTHLCRRLCVLGAKLHAVSRFVQAPPDENCRWWQADVTDLEAVRGLVQSIRPDVIFHLASFVSGVRGAEVVLPTFHNNLTSTVNLLVAASEQGCRRIILASSLEEPDTREAEPLPVSPYAAAKWSASVYARMFHALYQTPVTIARLFMVYGPGQRDLNKLVPYVTLSLLQGWTPQLTSGKRLIDWVYVEDVIEGLVAMADAPSVLGQAVELGSGRLVTVRRVVENLSEILRTPVEPVFGDLLDRPLERVRAADTTATFSQLGWKAATPLEEGLSRAVAWYAERLRAGALDLSRLGLASESSVRPISSRGESRL
jgi:nucleoside-diphosphate-sugar epimerase